MSRFGAWVRIVSISSGDNSKESQDPRCTEQDEGGDDIVGKHFIIVLRCSSI